jgi:hypothetical protein
MSWKFWHVVLEKDEGDHLYQSRERWRYITQGWERKKRPTCNKQRKANWIGHILRRNCLLKQFMRGKIEGTGRQGRRCKKLVKGLSEKRRYRNLKTEKLNCTRWRSRFGGGYEPVAEQNMKWTWLTSNVWQKLKKETYSDGVIMRITWHGKYMTAETGKGR